MVLVRLGRAPYGPVLELQRRLHSLRRERKTPDFLLSLEHEPVITLGRVGRNEDLLLSQDELRRMGVEIYTVERGGAATYHGPGQLVLYPILDLRGLGLGVREYVRQLEEVMIRTGKALAVELFRRPGYPGAWHRKGKVGFIGVYVRGWVTFHGLALNVDLRPNGFAWIVPCGAPGLPVVSLAELSPDGCTLAEVEGLAHSAFSAVFGVELVEISPREVWAWLNRIG